MKVFVDNQLIQKIVQTKDQNLKEIFLNEWAKAAPNYTEDSLQFILGWSSLLTYLNWDSLFENFPLLNEHNKIFCSVIEVLSMDSEKEVIVYLFDQIFVECLNQVKGLWQVNAEALLERIQHKRQEVSFSPEDPFSYALESYERMLSEDPKGTLHDLILYLAWDRVCVYLAAIFDHTSLKIKNGLTILKECLIESFQHIITQGKTVPSFFRLAEALYAYQMKDENLQNYSAVDWLTLCQSSNAIMPRENIVNASFIDFSVMMQSNLNKFSLVALTLDSVEKVKACLTLADYTMAKLKTEIADWQYTFRSREIVCLKKDENHFLVESVING